MTWHLNKFLLTIGSYGSRAKRARSIGGGVFDALAASATELSANLCIAIGRDRADLGNLLVRRYVLRVLLKISGNGLDREIDTAFEVHQVHAGNARYKAWPNAGEPQRCCATLSGHPYREGQHDRAAANGCFRCC
jgi:hypothetical protein